MAENYLDTLDEIDYQYLELMTAYPGYVNLRSNKMSDLEKEATRRIDEIIEGAPDTTTELELFFMYQDIPEFHEGGEFEDPAFIAASPKPPKEVKDSVVIRLKVSPKTKLLNLDDEVYILPRNTTMDMEKTKERIVPASLVRSGVKS